MMEFHFNNWLVYFYFYCIAGWIFESGNVSVRQKKWVNRGFMKGPWLLLSAPRASAWAELSVKTVI